MSINLPTKEQIDELIDSCLEIGNNEAAGLFRLASETLSQDLHKNEEKCSCFEVQGDNVNCPLHGRHFANHGKPVDEIIEADYDAWNDEQNRRHYEMIDSQEWDRYRDDLYLMGMGR